MAKYSDAKKAEALAVLAANGGNVKKTARDTHLPESTIRGWREGVGDASGGARELVPEKKADLANLFEDAAHEALGFLPEALVDAKARDLIIVAGTAVDKMRLLREQTTENVGHSDLGELLAAVWAEKRGESSSEDGSHGAQS